MCLKLASILLEPNGLKPEVRSEMLTPQGIPSSLWQIQREKFCFITYGM